MPSMPLRFRKPSPDTTTSSSSTSNPLPPLLHTPSGLAFLEIQGKIHFPSPTTNSPSSPSTLIGKLIFPLYNPSLDDPSDTKWMKKAYFYVGENQRMSGEVKKLQKPFAVVRKVEGKSGNNDGGEGEDTEMGGLDGGEGRGVGEEELEIVEIVRYKIVFSTRPEPVSTGGEEV